MDSFVVNRQVFDSWVFADAKAFKIWIWLIGRARWSDGFVSLRSGKGDVMVKVKRGQLIFGRYKAEEVLDLDGSFIYRKLQRFQDDKMITIESNSQYSLITICNYEDYQFSINENEQPVNSQCTANEQPMNTKNKINKIKKKEKISINTNPKESFSLLFFEDVEFVKVFTKYQEMRKSKHAPLTDYAKKLVIKKLDKLSGGDVGMAIELLNQSIECGWTGIFPIKQLNNQINTSIRVVAENKLQDDPRKKVT